MYAFGAGRLIGQRTDIANQSPVQFGTLQDVTFDISYTLKELMGQYSFAQAIGRGSGKITGKAKFATISGATINNLFFGLGSIAGQVLTAWNEMGTVPATTTFTVTVVNATGFKADWGVQYANGVNLTKVTTPTLAGTYSVNTTTGVYTFSTLDAGVNVFFTYNYLPAGSTAGSTLTMANPQMGVAPTFQMLFNTSYNGQQASLTLLNCLAQKLALATKLEDFTIPEMDFIASADPNNNVLQLSLAA